MILARKKYTLSDPSEVIADKIKSGSLASVLIIVPTNRKSRALRKELISASGGKVVGKINIDTIGTFSQKMHSALNDSPITLLSEAASAVLLKRCFRNNSLNYFNRYKTDIPAGTLSRIQNIIGEYKRHAITPEKLFAEALKLEGSEKLKALDIARIYSAYNEECSKGNTGEIGDVYADILKHDQSKFSSAFKSAYPEVDFVVINGFDEFTEPEVMIINNIPGDIIISFDYHHGNPGLFLHLKECYERFLSRGFIILDDVSLTKASSFQDIIRKEYFQGGASPKYDFNITELTALNRNREVEAIAKEIKEIIREKSVKPNEICVVFNLIQNYSPLVRDIFPVYGIPFNLTDRIPLNSAGPVTAIISFLEILETGFYYKSIFRALSSGFISIPGVYLSDLIRASSEVKIISGYENWIQLLEDRIRITDPPEKFIYRRAQDSILSLKNILSSLEKRMTIPDFKRNFLGILDKLNLPGNVLNIKGDTEFHFKSLSEFYGILNELFTLLISEYGSDKEFQLSFYLDEIRTAAENSRFNIQEKSGYGVQVTNLNEIRGLSFDYIFIGGMIDGELPTRYTPEIFYSGSFTREEWKHQVEERYHFYQSLCAWQKGLYLTRPLQEENKEHNPSNFLSELKNLFFIREKSEKDFSDSIYSYEELQEYAGENIFNENIINKLPDIKADEVKQTIDIHRQRQDSAIQSPYNGFISESLPEEARLRLKNITEKEFSATQLEIYAQCPFKYFLEKVLYLDVVEEPTEELESLELGRMIHDILYRFYKKINEEKTGLYQCSDDTFRKAGELIFAIADEVINELSNRSPLNFLELERLTGLNGDRKNSILYKFLLAERESSAGYLPYDFELPFGNIPEEDGKVNENKEFSIEGIRIRGKIDRIDINSAANKIRVTDYKLSGKKPEVNDLERGLSLQLPLYLYAAKEIISRKLKREFEPAGADIYSLKYQDGKFGRKPIVSEGRRTEEEILAEYERIISICTESIKKYVAKIGEGVFNLSALEDKERKACHYCNFKLICRINE